MISQQLLDILVCPLGKSDLKLEGDALVCQRCGPRFRISREGYPNMLIEEAELPAGCDHYNQLPCVRNGSSSSSPSGSTPPN
jgi:uncharacterized protein YbaR (Trm112 family)